MDDVYGNLTVAKKPNVQGITKFGIFISDELQSELAEDEYTDVDITTPSYSSSIPQNSGKVIYVYVYASDILGNVQVSLFCCTMDIYTQYIHLCIQRCINLVIIALIINFM